jgi:hypothetical protein
MQLAGCAQKAQVFPTPYIIADGTPKILKKALKQCGNKATRFTWLAVKKNIKY